VVCPNGITGTGVWRKREAWPSPRLIGLLRTARGLAGWGNFPVVIGNAVLGIVLFLRHPVSFTKPATEVNGFTAWRAEGELRPGAAFAGHLPLANWAANLAHRHIIHFSSAI